MRYLSLLVLVACGSEAKKKADDTLTLSAPAPAVGLVIHEDSTRRSTITLTRDGESSDLREDEHEVTRSEVVAVDGGAITRIRIAYEIDEGPDGASSLQGHSYEVWLDGGNIKAARVDGGSVGDAEAAALAADHGDLGKVPPLASVLVGRTWTRGEAVTVDDTTFTWIGAGIFATEKLFERDGIQTTLKGQIELDPKFVRPVQVTTNGTSTGELRGEMAGTTLTGTTSSHTVYRYE